MLEAGTMLLFCAVLFASVALGWSIIPALFVGVLLFMGYGLVRRCSLRAMASRAPATLASTSSNPPTHGAKNESVQRWSSTPPRGSCRAVGIR